jgi:hypothetical protein
MSFFDFENELPGWLGSVMEKNPGISEMQCQDKITKLDNAAKNSYHTVCAAKGEMANSCGNKSSQLWKWDAPNGDISLYGKYLECGDLQFWLGMSAEDSVKDPAKGKTVIPYLWFSDRRPPSCKKYFEEKLSPGPEKNPDKHGYWYTPKEQKDFIVPAAPGELGKAEDYVKKTANKLLKTVMEAVKKQ